ncbi:MAG: hypothetical protein U0P30_14015 [Vicinamibacterales bacterium]
MLLVDACLVTTEVTGPPLLLVVADASLLTPHFLLALRRGDPHRPVIAIGDADDPNEAMLRRKDVQFHLRPLDEQALLLAVGLAQVEGRSLRRSERRVVPRLATTVEGENAVLLDVSNEGLRLEVSTPAAARRLAPQFVVHVPSLRMGVPVQRVWLKSAPAGPNRTVQCGASLLATDERTIVAWKRLADPAGGPLYVTPRPAPAKVEQAGLFGRMSAAIASTPLVGALAPGSWRGGRS